MDFPSASLKKFPTFLSHDHESVTVMPKEFGQRVQGSFLSLFVRFVGGHVGCHAVEHGNTATISLTRLG